MVTRRLAVAFAALTLSACGTVSMSEGDAIETTSAALDSADVVVDDVIVEESGPESFTLSASTEEGPITLVLDAGAGRLTSIDLAEGVSVSEAQVEELARHHDNPADDRARTRRAVVGAVLVVVLLAGGLLWARRARLREAETTSD